MKGAAKRVGELTYSIREFFPLARELERKGHKVLYLNIGDPARWGFKPPAELMESLCRAVQEGYNYYSPSEGLYELREAIAEKERTWNNVEVSPSDVYVTFGVSEAIWLVITALLDPGDEILLPDPTYPLYTSYARLYGCKPIFYKCREEEGWTPDVDDIRKKVGPKTKAIVLINPNNPTGAVYERSILESVLDVAAENDLVVISDEIYDGLVFDDRHVATASLSRDVPVVGLNGFSKTYVITGWRLGYLYLKAPSGWEWLSSAIRRVALCRLGAATPIQKAMASVLRKPPEHLERMKSELRKRRDLLVKLLDETGFFDVAKPKGAFYAFPRLTVRGRWSSDKELVKQLLLEEKVLVVHGSGLGDAGKWHLRLVFLPPPEILEEAVRRIERFIKRNLYRA